MIALSGLYPDKAFGCGCFLTQLPKPIEKESTVFEQIILLKNLKV